MKTYLHLCQDILENGQRYNNRTGTDTLAVFGRTMRYDLLDGFPATTTKKAYFKGAIVELMWMLKGGTNADYLNRHQVRFWDQWAVKPPVRKRKDISHLLEMAREQDITVSKEALMEMDLDSLEVLLGETATYIEDNRYINTAPTYEYLIEQICDSIGLSEAQAKQRAFELYIEAVGDTDGIGVTKEQIAEVLRTCMEVKDTVAIKTCEVGDLGPIYGKLIRAFPNSDGTTTDQLAQVINSIRTQPHSRRHLVSLWAPELLPDERLTPEQNVALGKQALAPCHMLWTFMVTTATHYDRSRWLRSNYASIKHQHIDEIIAAEQKTRGGKLSRVDEFELLLKHIPETRLNLHFNMRSNDVAAGAPVNIMFYAALCQLMALHTDHIPGELFYSGTNVHLYVDQLEGIKEQLEREPYPAPTLRIKTRKENIWDHEPEDFELVGYQSHKAIKFAVAK